jgi:cytidylate kinase
LLNQIRILESHRIGDGQMSILTVSRQLGSNGDQIAALVAERLGLRLVDSELIGRAAQKAGVPQMALDEIEHEGDRGLATQVLQALRTMPSLQSASIGPPGPSREAGPVHRELTGLTFPFASIFSPTASPISASLETQVRMVGLIIRGLSREGNVVIVGRGGQVLLRKTPCAVHVQVIAPLQQRIEAVRIREGLDWRVAQSRVRASDRARSDYLRRYHGVDWLDPTLYHVVINTGRVSVSMAVDLIVDLLNASSSGLSPSQAHEATQDPGEAKPAGAQHLAPDS